MRFGVTVVSFALGAGVSCVSCASASFCDSSDDGSWVQVWGDEFEGDELDDTKWTKMTSDEGTVRGPIRPDEGTRTYTKDGGARGGAFLTAIMPHAPYPFLRAPCQCRTATCDEEDVYLQDGNLVMRSRRDDNNSSKYYTGAVRFGVQ